MNRNLLEGAQDQELQDQSQRLADKLHEHGLAPKQQLILKGARIIKHEKLIAGVQDVTTDEIQRLGPGLNADDLFVLENEGKWRQQPSMLYITVVLNSIAAVIQGWDQTGTNGANLIWLDEFGIPISGCTQGFGEPSQNEVNCLQNTL